ncbi:tryptophan 7-halogenase [Rhodobacter sp. KR11]|uniref:tryptophan halogenase family protein n=1 Tax=Rhodobacter sp. KR11 TaxID=2974588 RepID=UPI002223014B|nr:tryptophan halogenase family protein [Rhodobacter sp. KR11]MCW1919808.1 tryptophan 7-halogenase [Rhodobacter sp. KR11]
MTPKRIVIVGGGTAGWLAAMMLSDVAARKGWGAAVTVVESSRIGTIGVGEGSTAVFRQMLGHFGLSEAEFLRETGATIKYGIRHRDWRRVGHHYDGPIDDPGLVTGGLPLDAYAVAAGRSVGQAHLFQHLMDKGRAPVALRGGRQVAAGPFHHAYHFDQALVGAWLRRKARGIAVIDDEVAGIETGAAGIAALRMVSGARVEGDFFVDASGFKRALILGLGAEWISYADVLPVNRAMPFWVDLKPGQEIPPMTVAWAQKNGWLWQIPTQERFGMGYVYSDAHIGPEAAQAEVEAALGHKIEPRRDIKIDAGRLRAPWIGNCVALGLASSFLEPLEATSIHGTITQLMMLAEWLPLPDGAARYNAAVGAQVDDFRDFIRLHYVTERRDSGFWCDVAGSLPGALQDRLDLWATRLPRPSDFAPFALGLPHLQGQLYTPVLDGLGLLSRAAARAEMADAPLRDRTRAAHAGLVAEYTRAAGQCLPHRAWLDSLREKVS